MKDNKVIEILEVVLVKLEEIKVKLNVIENKIDIFFLLLTIKKELKEIVYNY